MENLNKKRPSEKPKKLWLEKRQRIETRIIHAKHEDIN